MEASVAGVGGLGPPPVAQLTATLKPLPQLGYGTANTILLLVSCIPMVLTDISARRGNRAVSQIGLVIGVMCGAGAAVLRGFEFSAMGGIISVNRKANGLT